MKTGGEGKRTTGRKSSGVLGESKELEDVCQELILLMDSGI